MILGGAFSRSAFLFSAVAFTLFCRSASAALTTSEIAQVKGFVQGARIENAARVRALVARPDLSLAESSSALSLAVAPAPFQESNEPFFRELLFGEASLSGRPVLVSAVTRALLARADALLAKHTADAGADVAELARIYAFLDSQIANAGHPEGAAHDAQTGIPPSTYEDCARVLAEHARKNSRWLSPESPVPPSFLRARGQEEVALFDMTNDSPTRRVDAASALGLTGARQKVLVELGVLLIDSGSADETRVERVRAALVRLSALRGGVEAIEFGDAAPLRSARGKAVTVAVPLEMPVEPVVPSDEVESSALDLPLFMLTYELSRPAATHALDARPELRRTTDQDVQSSRAAYGTMTTDQRLAGMMAQLLVEAPRTLDLAFARVLAGHTRTAALLSDALGALATVTPAANPGSGLTLSLGRSAGTDGGTERMDAQTVRVAPTGAVASFTLDSHRWEIQRDPVGTVDAVRRDGQLVTLAMLASARVPATLASSWSEGGLVFARLSGAPRVGIAAGSGVRVVGTGDGGVDAIATPAPAHDVVVEADLAVTGGEGGLALRAVSTKLGFQGASLVIVSGSPPRAILRIRDGKGVETNCGEPIALASPSGHVKLSARGATVEATLGDVTLKAPLPPALAYGDVAIRAAKGATVQVRGLMIRRR